MGALIEAAALAAAMRHAAGIAERRDGIPILAMVRLEVSRGSLEMTTSNLNIEYRQTIPLAAPSAAPFALAVDAARLAAIAGAGERGAQIMLEEHDRWLVVKTGASRWRLPSLPVDEFPAVAAGTMADAMDVDGEDLAALLRRVDWSTGTEQTRYYLCGTLIEAEAGKLRAVTTNGHCLSVVDSAIAWPAWGAEAIVPHTLARLLIKLADEAGGPVRLGWDKGLLRFEAGAVVITGKLIDGTYPDYRRLFPTEPGAPCVVDPHQLHTAIGRVVLISGERTRAVKIERVEGKVVLGVVSPEYGTASAEVPADGAAAAEMGINADYLARALESIGGDSVELTQRQAGEIVMIRRVVRDGAVVLMMPMRL